MGFYFNGIRNPWVIIGCKPRKRLSKLPIGAQSFALLLVVVEIGVAGSGVDLKTLDNCEVTKTLVNTVGLDSLIVVLPHKCEAALSDRHFP